MIQLAVLAQERGTLWIVVVMMAVALLALWFV
jgi:hypothetical protein